MTKAEQLNQVKNFISRGENIKRKCELQNDMAAVQGMVLSGVSGNEYNAWLGEINIFNERYLKDHPLYSFIKNTYFFNRTKDSTFEDMMGHLTALVADKEYWGESDRLSMPANIHNAVITPDLIIEI